MIRASGFTSESKVTVWIPFSSADWSAGTRASGSFAEMSSASGSCAIAALITSTCCCASASVEPLNSVVSPSSAAASCMPAFVRSKTGLPTFLGIM